MSEAYLAKVPISYTWETRKDSGKERRSPSFKLPLPHILGEATACLEICDCRDPHYMYPHLDYNLNFKTDYPIMIAEHSFSFLDCDSGTVLHAEKFNRIICLDQYRSVILYSDRKRCFDNKVIIIRVDATLYCPVIAAAVSVAKTCKVPLDDVRKELHSLYKESVLADVTIVSQGKEFKAHKVVLASQSSVFRKMFELDMKEKETNTVEMPDIGPPVISDLLDFIYTGEVPNIGTMAKELLNVADKYELPNLFNVCQEELGKLINPSNALEIFSLAMLHHAEYLKKECLKTISFNFETTHNSPGWVNLTEEEEKALLYEVIALKY